MHVTVSELGKGKRNFKICAIFNQTSLNDSGQNVKTLT